MNAKLKVAYFITSHGYGHATRTLAILDVFAKQVNSLEISIFSSLPKQFFEESLKSINLKVYSIQTDVGLIQKSPFEHNINSTINELERFLLFKNPEFEQTKKILQSIKPSFIVSDISPLGIFLANQLKIPSVLIENFTWDWIYKSYLKDEPRFGSLMQRLREILALTDLRIQTRPICERINKLPLINPIFRTARESAKSTKTKLGIKNQKPIVLITTGGITQDFTFIEKLEKRDDFTFIITGNTQKAENKENIIFISSNSSHYFPDIVQSASLIVGKAGYGTVAEAWGNNKVFFPVFRHNFRESSTLKAFLDLEVPGKELSLEKFLSGNWIYELNINSNKTNQFEAKKEKLNGKNQVFQLISNWLN